MSSYKNTELDQNDENLRKGLDHFKTIEIAVYSEGSRTVIDYSGLTPQAFTTQDEEGERKAFYIGEGTDEKPFIMLYGRWSDFYAYMRYKAIEDDSPVCYAHGPTAIEFEYGTVRVAQPDGTELFLEGDLSIEKL